jgi:hypothetical protein
MMVSSQGFKRGSRMVKSKINARQDKRRRAKKAGKYYAG